MKLQHDPRRLDVVGFAADGAALDGAWPLASMRRLAAEAAPDAEDAASDVVWSAQGRHPAGAGGGPGPAQTWLRLRAQVTMPLQCQRCLQPVVLPIDVDRALRFVADEATATALDAESDDDVLAVAGPLDLLDLVEDELLLGLPLVPLHERCPSPLPMSAAAEAGPQEAPAHPFAALAALRRKVN